MSQADRIIGKFGGITRMSRALGEGYYPTLISGWKRRRVIPQEHHQKIYDAAKRDGIPLDPRDFLMIDEINAA
jgi:hypothetical protein